MTKPWDGDWNGSRMDHRVGWGQRVDQEWSSTRKNCDRDQAEVNWDWTGAWVGTELDRQGLN